MSKYYKRVNEKGVLDWVATVPEGHVMETDDFVTEITQEEFIKCQQELANKFPDDDELEAPVPDIEGVAPDGVEGLPE